MEERVCCPLHKPQATPASVLLAIVVQAVKPLLALASTATAEFALWMEVGNQFARIALMDSLEHNVRSISAPKITVVLKVLVPSALDHQSVSASLTTRAFSVMSQSAN